MKWSWKAFDYIMMIGAFILALGVWFIPSFQGSPEFQSVIKAVNQRKAERLAYEAGERKLAKEREELGIVYFGPADRYFPGDNAKAKEGAKPDAGKPAKAASKASKSSAKASKADNN